MLSVGTFLSESGVIGAQSPCQVEFAQANSLEKHMIKVRHPIILMIRKRGGVPEMGGVSMQSLMASAVAKMVRKKSVSFPTQCRQP